MTAKRAKPELDQVDYEALVAMSQTRGWRLFRVRVETTLAKKLTELERDADHEKTLQLRAEIRTLRAVLAIPDILQSEARTGAEKQRESEES